MPNEKSSRRVRFRHLIPWQIENLRFAFGAPLSYRLGHFYSPVCDPAEIARYYHDLESMPLPDSIPGIDLNRDHQIGRWLRWLSTFSDCVLLTGACRRYQPHNRYFCLGEAVILHSFLRELKPRRLVEIGSGFSSASAIDTIDVHLGWSVACTFIDPHPERLVDLLSLADRQRVTILCQPVQTVDFSVFDALSENDILFIDTSHVLKTASDLVFELFEVIPRLKSGVFVHFHDIHYPFEYPSRWVTKLNYSWNETYALRAFLQYNRAFEIVFFNDYFWKKCRSHLAEAAVPQLRNGLGSGLWLRRI